MQSRSHVLLQGARIPRASLNASVGCGCASYKLPRRCYATQRPQRPAPKKIAVLGGGITGLTTAYYLSKSLPNATITIYEASGRFGGWLQSKRVKVPDGGGFVTFEQGPRTLRKGLWGIFTLELLLELGLQGDIRGATKDSVAAKNRYFYDQDHIVRLPSSIKDALFSGERVIYTAIREVLFEWCWKKPEFGHGDESITDFLARRGLKQTGDDLASAFLHGVYAGNIDELSAKSTPPFDRLSHLEHANGSITNGLLAKQKDFVTVPTRLQKMSNHRLPLDIFSKNPNLLVWWVNTSVFALKDGLGSLANVLEKKLIQNRTSSILKTYDLVISALPAKTTGEIALAGLRSGTGSASLAKNRQAMKEAFNVPTVTVMVVNLFYKQPGLVPHQGFGYLIPKTVPGEQNPERALGVIFDSDIIPGMDSAGGTKLTVMLGGHWWNGWPESSLPDEEEAVLAAKSLLARHLKIEAEPVLTNVALQKDCIPQYNVGHQQKLYAAHEALKEVYEGRVRVVGNSYYGVGVHDCVVAARQMAENVMEEVAEGVLHSGRTGLEASADEHLSGWTHYRVHPTVLKLM
ncbi:hypothetical protein BC567DRAFT_161192 [Phyllosticta citribraziliensis]